MEESRPARPVPARKPRYVPPLVMTGMMVFWKNNPGSPEQVAGIVTKIGHNTIDILTFPPETPRPLYKEGCRHVKDPEVKKILQPDIGVWQHAPWTDILLKTAALVLADEEVLAPLRVAMGLDEPMMSSRTA